jgi:hypothetical protein
LLPTPGNLFKKCFNNLTTQPTYKGQAALELRGEPQPIFQEPASRYDLCLDLRNSCANTYKQTHLVHKFLLPFSLTSVLGYEGTNTPSPITSLLRHCYAKGH